MASAFQFNPESFVDSLLGIGQFGSSSKKNEGDLLAARLVDLRQQRDSRAQVQRELDSVGVAATSVVGNGLPDNLPRSAATRPANPNRSKSKKKKAKR